MNWEGKSFEQRQLDRQLEQTYQQEKARNKELSKRNYSGDPLAQLPKTKLANFLSSVGTKLLILAFVVFCFTNVFNINTPIIFGMSILKITFLSGLVLVILGQLAGYIIMFFWIIILIQAILVFTMQAYMYIPFIIVEVLVSIFVVKMLVAKE